jgi:N-acetylglucosamine-6-phosphate deacetylase
MCNVMKVIAEDLLTGNFWSIAIETDRYSMVQTDPSPTQGVYISVGWVDLQANGFAGIDVNRAGLTGRDISEMNATLQREGITGWLPTLVTAPYEHILNNLQVITTACEQDQLLGMSIPGIHLEGPYISAEQGSRGAHTLAYIRDPDWDEFQRWQEVAHGRIRLITVAPERPGAIKFIRKVVYSGVVVAIGHTAASNMLIHEAVEEGASLSTHLGNGISSQIHRHNNPIWDQLAEDRLSASVIFDGFHLPPNVMRVILRAKGIDRCILVSDSVSLAHMPSGIYETLIGGKVVLHEDGRLSMYGSEYLAGSASSLKDCIEVSLRTRLCTLVQTTQMVGVNPRRIIKLPSDNNYTIFQVEPLSNKISILALIQSSKITYINPDPSTSNMYELDKDNNPLVN